MNRDSAEKDSKAVCRLSGKKHCDEVVPPTVSREKAHGLTHSLSLQHTEIVRWIWSLPDPPKTSEFENTASQKLLIFTSFLLGHTPPYKKNLDSPLYHLGNGIRL